jgi:hypothetical protein
LDEKLGVVLPKAVGIKGPKERPVWQKYKDMEAIRHDIIHLKTVHVYHQPDLRPTIWNRLLKSPLLEAYLVAKEMIAEFYNKADSPPMWFRKLPF